MQGKIVGTTDLKKTLTEKAEVNVAVEKRSNNFQELLRSMSGEIAKALPSHLTPERMIRVALSAYSSNLKLQQCDPMSIIGAILLSSQLGLEINNDLGQAYLIPYKNNKTGKMEAKFQRGYRGELTLAYRTKQYKLISAYKVYKNDVFEYALGLNQKLEHKPADSQEGEPTHYYAIYKTISGGEAFFVMSREAATKHAKRFSESYRKGFGPWVSDFDSMAMKTCLKQLLNYAPKTIEYELQYAQDDVVKREIATDSETSMFSVPNVIDYESEIEEQK